MKKRNFLIPILIISLIFLVSCAEQISDEELDKELEQLSEEELEYVLAEDEAIVGEALRVIYRRNPKLSKLRRIIDFKRRISACTDNDLGRNYLTKGIAGARDKSFTDYCQDSRYLFEYDCGYAGGINLQDGCGHSGLGGCRYDCKDLGSNYVCEEGACIEQELPDLIVEDISTGIEGSTQGIKVTVCNDGKSETFDELKIKLNSLKEYDLIINDLTLDRDECYSKTVLYFLVVGFPVHPEEEFEIQAEVDPDNEIEEFNENNNILNKIVRIPTCGNYECEEGEEYESCPLDCEVPCKSEFCNDNVLVYCGCSEYDVLSQRHNCVRRAGPCENCGEQEDLFDDFLEMQTSVYDCLANYFEYEPLRITYLIYSDPPETIPICEQEEGCCCREGGHVDLKYILQHNLMGFDPYGKNHPTEPIHLIADEHEATHSFLYQMLHYIPNWFHEAIAIQTNERLGCDTAAQPFDHGEAYEQSLHGDAYLRETEVDNPNYGVGMGDGTVLNENYYQRLKSGETCLTENDRNKHVIGTLWIIGLKEDYGCTEDCIKQIIIKLRDFEMENCQAGTGCGVDPIYGNAIIEHIDNAIIKQKTDEVVGQDTSALFDLLEIEQNGRLGIGSGESCPT